MTVLEKIERCVSLVWDFQEIYDEEDIEDFCRNELHTYPQYNEIFDYFKRIEELEKENAELKGLKDVATLIRANNDTVIALMQLNNKLVSKEKQLTKAKELLKKWVELSKPKLEGYPIPPIQEQTEQFLNSEVEK